MRLRSPCKINEFLKIVNGGLKRDDGYHEIITVMQTMNFYDEMEVCLLDEGGDVLEDILECDNEDVPRKKEENTILIAADLFRKETSVNRYFKVSLVKRIPLGSGLGGGSSNAATFLYAANRLCGTNLSDEKLAVIGAKIGSDVPFFLLCEGRGLCTGRGEQVLRMPRIKYLEYCYLVLSPKKLACRTKEIFEIFDSTKGDDGSGVVLGLFTNDLQSAACKKYPEFLGVFEWLKTKEYNNCYMSGSGSTIVAFHENFQESGQKICGDFELVSVECVYRDSNDGWW
jgi:4-diphosphocytidyl-2-C-methyl-D-erythritol kinase